MSAWDGPPRRYHYTLDDQGRLFHAGDEITHARMLKIFFRDLEPLPDGRFLSRCAGEENLLTVADTPFVVVGLIVERNAADAIAAISLLLQDGGVERLDPSTLHVADDIARCRVRHGVFEARFARRAQASLFSWAEMVDGEAQLAIGDAVIVLGTFPEL